MPRGRAPLTEAQQVTLDILAETDLRYRSARLESAERIRKEIAKELGALEIERFYAARDAVAMGIAKAHIRDEGLHTSNPGALRTILDRFQVEEDETAVAVKPPIAESRPNFEWLADGNVRVNYLEFKTTSKVPTYPARLSGVVHREPNGRWSVVIDPTNEESEFGTIPGFLSFEIDTVPQGTTGSITLELEAWRETHL